MTSTPLCLSFYGECVRNGCRLSDEPIFVISDRKDYIEGFIGEEKFPVLRVRACKKTKEAVVLPACKALSVLYYGDYGNVNAAWLRLGEEVKKRGLKPVGSPRVLGIVAPYTARKSPRGGTVRALSFRGIKIGISLLIPKKS